MSRRWPNPRRLGRSLTARIALSAVAASAIAMAAMVVAVYTILTAQQNRSIHARLDDHVETVTATLQVSDGHLIQRRVSSESIDDSTWVFDASGVAIASPASAPRLTSVAKSLSTVREPRTVSIDDHVFRAAPVQVGAKSATIVAATSTLPYEESRTIALFGLILLAVMVTAGSAALTTVTVRRTLQPIDQMADNARDWSARNLDTRFDVVGADELTRLGRTLNQLLDRVAGALRNEQRLTSELAHELRTPLAAIRGEIELAMMDPSAGPESRVRLDRAMSLIDQLGDTIGTLLSLAREAETGPAQSPLAGLIQQTLGPYELRGVDVVVDELPAVWIAAPTAVAARALSPVVDNAVRYATSRIDLTAEADDRTVAIRVSDDGPGVKGDAEVFATRGRSDDSPGAGLGLALSRRIARTLGGDVRLVSPAEPTVFELTLPRA